MVRFTFYTCTRGRIVNWNVSPVFLSWHISLQSNQMFCSPEYCNAVGNTAIFYCEIALSKLQPMWSNCKLKFTTRFVKHSLWLATSSKEQPIHLLRVFNWFFFATSSQSETFLQIWLWILTCNLIMSVATCSEQSRNQNCNIPNNIAIISGEQNIRFDCKLN